MKKLTLLWPLLSLLAFPLLSLGAGTDASDDDVDDDDDDSPPANGNTLAETLAARYGDAKAALAALASENHTLRKQRRELRKKVPAEGALVLTQEQAAAWQAYQGLGKPEEVQAALGERDTLKEQVTRATREQTFRAAATAHGYNPDALAKFLAGRGVTLTETQATQDGKAVTLYSVQGDGDTTEPLPAWLEAHEAWALPALTAGMQGAPSPRYVRQVPGTPEPATNPALTLIRQRYGKKE